MNLPNRCKDITGQRFGSLIAVEFQCIRNHMAYWKYQCDCGKWHTARANTITYEAKKKTDPRLPSCGCMEMALKTKHGFRKAKDTHPAYRAYRGIMDRCYNPNSSTYKWYGACGITICNEWKNNPQAFVTWAIENGWEPKKHIDKDILCDKLGIHPHIYSPQTCQWVTAKVNVGYATNRDNFGKHPNIKLSHDQVQEIIMAYQSGTETNMSQLARDYGVSHGCIRKLLFVAGVKDRK